MALGDLTHLSRAKLVGLIHAGAARLAKDAVFSEEDRRQLQQGLTGKASCSEMSVVELRRVIEALDQRGAFPRPTGRKAGTGRKPEGFGGSRQKILDWIEALLAEKARLEGLPVSWAYADAIARNQTGISACRMVQDVRQLQAIGVALQKHVARIEARGA